VLQRKRKRYVDMYLGCETCEKRFGEKRNLERHMRIHTNERPYACDVCEMKFRHSGSLKTHMRIHANEKPYECDESA